MRGQRTLAQPEVLQHPAPCERVTITAYADKSARYVYDNAIDYRLNVSFLSLSPHTNRRYFSGLFVLRFKLLFNLETLPEYRSSVLAPTPREHFDKLVFYYALKPTVTKTPLSYA